MKKNNFILTQKYFLLIFFINIIFVNFNYQFLYANELNQNAKVIFEKGNDFYKKQNYLEAINNYKLLIDNGFKSSDLYFNLANSYYKNEEIGLSIVFYEKALLLEPSDEDIYFNLQIANLKTVDKFNNVEINPITKNINSIIYSLHSNTWVYLSVVLFILTLTFLLILFFGKSKFKGLSLILGITTFFSFLILTFFAFYTYTKYTSDKFGIVIMTNVYVKFSPDENSDNQIMIHEGTKFEIIETVNNWMKIKLPDGNVGWIDNKNIFEI